jgi:hypothetical protein
MIALLALALAACSGGGSDKPVTAKDAAKNAKPYVPPKTSPTEPSTTTTVPEKPADALALAARLGCVNPKPDDPSSNLDFGPKATGSTRCKLPDGTVIDVTTYKPAGITALQSPVMVSAMCQIAKGFELTPPFYTVYGADFEVDVTTEGDTLENPPDYKAKTQAIADALGLDVTTLDCKKS